MTRYMLDTNAVSHLLRGHKAVQRRVVHMPMSALFISAVTEGEIAFGLARRPVALNLHRAVAELFKRIDVLPWDRAAAAQYGVLRARQQQAGQTLTPLDLLIAAHAVSAGLVLVSNDHAFAQVADLVVEDWSVGCG